MLGPVEHDEVAFSDLSVAVPWRERLADEQQRQYNARSLNPAMVAHNLANAVDKRSHYVQNYWWV